MLSSSLYVICIEWPLCRSGLDDDGCLFDLYIKQVLSIHYLTLSCVLLLTPTVDTS